MKGKHARFVFFAADGPIQDLTHHDARQLLKVLAWAVGTDDGDCGACTGVDGVPAKAGCVPCLARGIAARLQERRRWRLWKVRSGPGRAARLERLPRASARLEGRVAKVRGRG